MKRYTFILRNLFQISVKAKDEADARKKVLDFTGEPGYLADVQDSNK